MTGIPSATPAGASRSGRRRLFGPIRWTARGASHMRLGPRPACGGRRATEAGPGPRSNPDTDGRRSRSRSAQTRWCSRPRSGLPPCGPAGAAGSQSSRGRAGQQERTTGHPVSQAVAAGPGDRAGGPAHARRGCPAGNRSRYPGLGDSPGGRGRSRVHRVRTCAACRPGVLPAGLGTLLRQLRDSAAVSSVSSPIRPGRGHHRPAPRRAMEEAP